ncbi:MAG: hypothetical protein JWL75_5 [Parcubacteria group bacterium]|nr:hypothetical protein [Parcubacteria group bacterium]
MDDYTQMYIFFAVTTAAVILITALMGGLLVMLIRFFNTLNHIAKDVQESAEEIRADFDELREDVKRGFRFVPFFNFFSKTAKRGTPKKSARKTAQK